MSEFSSLSPKELSILANVIALVLAEDRTPDDINVLSNFLSAIGSLLSTIAAQQQSLQALQDKLDQNNQSKKNSH
jgi:Sec-independent protein translocase protein TatA